MQGSNILKKRLRKFSQTPFVLYKLFAYDRSAERSDAADDTRNAGDNRTRAEFDVLFIHFGKLSSIGHVGRAARNSRSYGSKTDKAEHKDRTDDKKYAADESPQFCVATLRSASTVKTRPRMINTAAMQVRKLNLNTDLLVTPITVCSEIFAPNAILNTL